MIIQSDLESLKRMLGCDEASIPPLLQREYHIRLRMYHGDGNSGPIGTIGLIDLVRYLKYGPKPQAEPPRVIDWTRMPTNGSLQVEARMAGRNESGEEEWRPGVYLGRVGVGGMAIRLAGDTWVHEFSQRDVRLLTAKDPKEKASEIPVVVPVISQAELSPIQREVAEAVADPTNPVMDAKVGDVVWAQDENGAYEGIYQDLDATGVVVLLEGETEPRSFPINKIIHAAAQVE